MKKQWMIVLSVVLLLSGCSIGNSSSTPKDVKKEVVERKFAYQYHYETLKKKDKKNYQMLYEGFVKRKKSIMFDKMSEDKVDELMAYVRSDHPELFYVDIEYTFLQLDDEKAMKVYPKYTTTKKETKALQAQVDAIALEIVAPLSGASEYEKVKAVYNYVTQSVEYVDGGENNQNILSALINKKSVCAGYARAAQYLLLSMGMESTVIEGFTQDDPKAEIGHAWNMVKVDNDYYYFDSTWGDVVEHFPHSCMGFFLMNSTEMLQVYIPDYIYEPTLVGDKTWASLEGATLAYWDEDALAYLWQQAVQNNRNYIEFKVDPLAYEGVKNELSNGQRMYTIMENEGIYSNSFSYIEDASGTVFDIYY